MKKRIIVLMGLVGMTATAVWASGYLEVKTEQRGTIAVEGPAIEREVLTPAGSDADLRWKVGETITLTFDLRTKGTQGPVYNGKGMSLGFGFGDGRQALVWGISFVGPEEAYMNAGIDSSAADASQMSLSFGSRSDKVKVTQINGTTHDLRQHREQAHFELKATRVKSTLVEMEMVWSNSSSENVVDKVQIRKRYTKAMGDLNQFMVRTDLLMGAPEMEIINLLIRKK